MSREKSPVSTLVAKPSRRSLQSDITKGKHRWLKSKDWGRLLAGVGALAAALSTGLNLGFVQMSERQVQTLLFEIRGPVVAPKDVVILAIDESSLSQGEFFRNDPQKYPFLEPIQSWPWQRAAYAEVIDRVMASGARAVALDIIFSASSSYGDADDQRFAQVLQQHKGRVVLASQYSESDTPQGLVTQLTSPLSQLCNVSDCTGYINFFVDPDGRIHQLGNQFLRQLLQNSPPEQSGALTELPTFVDATLKAAQRSYPPPKGDSIYFYGPGETFEHVPFWYVLDPGTWKSYLQSGAYFKDKIVLIGSTATLHQDFHAAPFSKSRLYPQPMAGVEIHANAIATLLQDKSIAEVIPQAPLRGLVVLVGVGAAGLLLSRPKQPLWRLLWATGLATVWMGISYGLFNYGQLIVPTAIPVGTIFAIGLSQLVIGSVKEQRKKQQLRDTLKQYVTSPIVQEIISQQEDLQDLLRERELALSGKILGGRYRIVRVLGSGGFSETYVAQDVQRPGSPQCVVKQLRVISNDPNMLRLARRLFATEAETLERLGKHNQIPQLLASFEENQEFYLVQEFVQGHPLSKEILPHRLLAEAQVVKILHDLMTVLEFVHNQGVIHRDLKPSNIMRREADGTLVLIDFGIAKKITTQLAEGSGQTKFTVSVGTPGYMPSEQSAGRPQFNSDIYALGMIAIEALTGRAPHALNHDARTGAVIWMNHALWVNADFAGVLNKMVHHDYTQRYRSIKEAQSALAPFLDRFVAPRESREFNLEDSSQSSDDRTEINSKTVSYTLGNTENDVTISLPEDWMDE